MYTFNNWSLIKQVMGQFTPNQTNRRRHYKVSFKDKKSECVLSHRFHLTLPVEQPYVCLTFFLVVNVACRRRQAVNLGICCGDICLHLNNKLPNMFSDI